MLGHAGATGAAWAYWGYRGCLGMLGLLGQTGTAGAAWARWDWRGVSGSGPRVPLVPRRWWGPRQPTAQFRGLRSLVPTIPSQQAGCRGGCLQEIFGSGRVSGTGLPGPPGSARVGEATGRSCLISPSLPAKPRKPPAPWHHPAVSCVRSPHQIPPAHNLAPTTLLVGIRGPASPHPIPLAGLNASLGVPHAQAGWGTKPRGWFWEAGWDSEPTPRWALPRVRACPGSRARARSVHECRPSGGWAGSCQAVRALARRCPPAPARLPGKAFPHVLPLPGGKRNGPGPVPNPHPRGLPPQLGLAPLPHPHPETARPYPDPAPVPSPCA